MSMPHLQLGKMRVEHFQSVCVPVVFTVGEVYHSHKVGGVDLLMGPDDQKLKGVAVNIVGGDLLILRGSQKEHLRVNESLNFIEPHKKFAVFERIFL